MARYNETRDALKGLCKEEGIEVKKGEYQIRMTRCIEFLMQNYRIPKSIANTILANVVINGLIEVRQGGRSKKWYVIIGEMLAVSSKGVIEDENSEIVKEASGEEE